MHSMVLNAYRVSYTCTHAHIHSECTMKPTHCLPVSSFPARNPIAGDSNTNAVGPILRYRLIPHHKPAGRLGISIPPMTAFM